jgi:pilus assembly protein CpaE
MQALTFITLSGKQQASTKVKEALTSSSRTRLLADCEDPRQMVADVLRLKPAAALIVLDANNGDQEFSLIKQLASSCPATTIITAAHETSPSLILKSIRSGASEFLQLPIVDEEFNTVLDRVAELWQTHQGATTKSGRVVAVFSNKGGAGVSFFATNLAAAINVNTLLVDLNLQVGDTASFLGLDPKYTMNDLVMNRSRLDDALINSLITPYSSRLSLLAAPAEPHEADDIEPQHVTEALHVLAQRFACTVLDLQHTFDPITVAGLDVADQILLIMNLDIPGIRSTKRALKVFERLGYPRSKVRVIVNRWSKNIDVELQKVEAHLDEQLLGLIPNDYRKVIDSINLGRPLVETDPNSKITIEIKRIASLLERPDQNVSPQPRKRLLGAVFGRQSSNGNGSVELSVMPDTA